MNRNRRLWPILLVLLALILASCGGGAAEVESVEEEAGAGEAAAEEQVVITADSVKDGVEMKIGQKALVKLDTTYDWDLVITPNLVADKVKDAVLAEDTQAEIEAKLAGSAVIQGIGRAKCKQDNPPCDTPSKQLLIKIKVTP